jgi:hypothetical protein
VAPRDANAASVSPKPKTDELQAKPGKALAPEPEPEPAEEDDEVEPLDLASVREPYILYLLYRSLYGGLYERLHTIRHFPPQVDPMDPVLEWTIFTIILCLIALSVLFEQMRDAIEERAGPDMKAIVDQVHNPHRRFICMRGTGCTGCPSLRAVRVVTLMRGRARPDVRGADGARLPRPHHLPHHPGPLMTRSSIFCIGILYDSLTFSMLQYHRTLHSPGPHHLPHHPGGGAGRAVVRPLRREHRGFGGGAGAHALQPLLHHGRLHHRDRGGDPVRPGQHRGPRATA